MNNIKKELLIKTMSKLYIMFCFPKRIKNNKIIYEWIDKEVETLYYDCQKILRR